MLIPWLATLLSLVFQVKPVCGAEASLHVEQKYRKGAAKQCRGSCQGGHSRQARPPFLTSKFPLLPEPGNTGNMQPVWEGEIIPAVYESTCFFHSLTKIIGQHAQSSGQCLDAKEHAGTSVSKKCDIWQALHKQTCGNTLYSPTQRSMWKHRNSFQAI